MSKHFKLIKEQMAAAGIALSDAQAERFSEYFDLLVEWNARMNLTAITEPEEVIEKHFCDSLAIRPLMGDITQHTSLSSVNTILDVGSGAGFPGIPLAIVQPEWQVTLLDSLKKRSEFQEAVREALQLDNLRIVNGRAEDVSRETLHREAYDLVVSRAVADLTVLSEYCVPFVRTGGAFVAYKGAEIADEIAGARKAVEILGGTEPEIVSYVLPSGAARSLVVVRKEAQTPEKYPRRAGIPSKRPLK